MNLNRALQFLCDAVARASLGVSVRVHRMIEAAIAKVQALLAIERAAA